MLVVDKDLQKKQQKMEKVYCCYFEHFHFLVDFVDANIQLGEMVIVVDEEKLVCWRNWILLVVDYYSMTKKKQMKNVHLLRKQKQQIHIVVVVDVEVDEDR